MTSGSQDMQQGSATRRSRKLYWLSGSSLAAAAFLMVSAPQAAQAQLRAPGLIQDNAPHRNNADIPRPDLAQNQPHNRAPGLLARDIRISAPVTPLPVNDIRISSPAPANLSKHFFACFPAGSFPAPSNPCRCQCQRCPYFCAGRAGSGQYPDQFFSADAGCQSTASARWARRHQSTPGDWRSDFQYSGLSGKWCFCICRYDSFKSGRCRCRDRVWGGNVH